MPGEWRALYRKTFEAILRKPSSRDGYSAQTVRRAESRLGAKLPRALRDYYLLIGRHALNRVFNQLLAPNRIEISGGHLVFQEENQAVVVWGTKVSSEANDPAVFVANILNDGTTGPWLPEKARCSQFLSAMLCWQAVCGGLPHRACAERVGKPALQRVKRCWPLLGRTWQLAAYASNGKVVCVVKDGKRSFLEVAGRTEKDVTAIEATVGLEMVAV
ncbi:MAG: hypothetical protein FJ271_26300 [Planctomycetes bacterium]|nr:hypothetical protein [Planctomycetota bacterium]